MPIASFDPKEAKAIRKAARIEWAKAQGCYPACGLKALLGEAQNFAQWAAESEDVQALVAAGLIEEGTAATG